MGQLGRSLARLFSQQHPAPDHAPHKEHAPDHPAHGQPAPSPSGQKQAAASQPSTNEVLDYLGVLAKEYHLPPKFVNGVASAESGFTPDLEIPNYLTDKHGNIVHGKHGDKIVKSVDYGLMQINSRRIGHDVVKDAHGHPFKIGDDVKTDWKANARAGVAILASAYHLAKLEQGPGATEEDHAQQAYSQYNGSARARDRYLKERPDGLPKNDADRNFLLRYRQRPEKR
ncbi:MAG: lytic transglycosylase domain-containing protein [Acidobacteriia bacterium]|nr:lytic transglycosylase domain-containing protein [Terriglobia bacterium]